MNTQTITNEKTTTSFRLNSDLVERLRTMARRNNRSLNNEQGSKFRKDLKR